MDRPKVCQVPEGSAEQKKMEKSGCEIICGAPTTLAVKGLMMMMMMMMMTTTMTMERFVTVRCGLAWQYILLAALFFFFKGKKIKTAMTTTI